MEHLRLLASAIAGQPLEVLRSEPPEPPWTDGRTIHLPAGMNARDDVRAVAVQAALVGAGSLAPDVMRRLVRRPAQARRYLTSEGRRALSECEDLLPPAARALIGRGGSDLPPAFGTLRPRRVLAAAEERTPADVAVAGVGDASATRVSSLDDDDEGVGPGEDLGQLFSNQAGSGGPLGRLLARLLAPARGRTGDGPVGAGTPSRSTARRPGAGRPTTVVLSPGAGDGDAAGSEATGTWYPEWDVRRGRYRDAWCRVAEHDAPLDDRAAAPRFDSTALRRPLARLGAGLEPTRRQRDGEDVDLDAGVEAWVDAAAGANPDDGVYLTKLRHRRDLAVLVLLDTSGSAGEPGTGGVPVHDHQQRAAADLVAALHDLGDRVALYGFNSRGRTAVQLLRVKAFDDHLDAASARRFDGLTPAAYTRLGAAIRHGTAILDARAGTPHRLLVVLSDGLAYDHGYEGRYGEADARRALIEARRRGVGCLCLSVGATGEPAALRRVFGTAAHASVPRPDRLPSLIGPLFRTALRSAEAQQRVHQRRHRARQHAFVARMTG
ncbi:MAG TPA: VWA domain-containing protein [Acidimicrobiales bacterium]|nr:VWA domain-containing protein [Acidimicrobiales bacterium]